MAPLLHVLVLDVHLERVLVFVHFVAVWTGHCLLHARVNVLHVTAKVPCGHIFVTGLAVHLTCNSGHLFHDLYEL
jgi:hypothetical protein